MNLYTPFSTQLSGSARETELRLRSIFQWKRRRPPVALLALVLAAAVGCGGLVAYQGPAQQVVEMEDQLDILVNARDTWRVLDETDWWGYAVTDLDQNGRLELIASETHGTGHFTSTRIWEVNEALDGLTVCETDESCSPSIGRVLGLPVYYDGKTGLFWYVLQNEVREDSRHYHESLQAVTLNEGQMEGNFLAFRETELPENGGEKSIYQDGQGKIITKGEYQQLTLDHLPGMEPMTAWMSWIEDIRIDELDDETLYAMLKGSEEEFVMVSGSLRPTDPYHEILELHYKALSDLEAWDQTPDERVNWELIHPYWAYEPDADLLAGTGYTRRDLDGDGSDELLIGWTADKIWSMDQGYIFSAYTLTDQGPMMYFGGGARCRYILCEDGTVGERFVKT